MLHRHIKSLPHHPKRVIVISLVLALAIGFFGFIEINKKIANPDIAPDSATTNANSSGAQNITLGFLSGGRIKSVSVKTGDSVKKGQVLAELDAGNTIGALTQAKAAYQIAQANYEKIINGATGVAIDVAKTAVNTAQVNLDEVAKQQSTLVSNAYRNLLNSTPEAVPHNGTSDYVSPAVISGSYNLDKEGVIKLNLYYSTGGIGFSASGLVTGSGSCNTATSQPIGDSGLYIKCPTNAINISDWDIQIPNTKASNYLANYNAYQLAVQTQEQTTAGAQATLDQANASLQSVVVNARPEDVAVAQAQVENASGALQIANAAYDNTIIIAPGDGTVMSVNVTPGQIAVPNAPAIQLITNNQ